MKPTEFDALMQQSLADRAVSRGESRALRDQLQAAKLTEAQVRGLRGRAFDVARRELIDPASKDVLEWIEQIVKLLDNVHPDVPQSRVAEVWFTPEMDAVQRIQKLIDEASHSVAVCVYTITDNRLTRALEHAHARRVNVRIITESEKALDLGSDIRRLRERGIPVRADRSDRGLMHHKYAVFDQRLLMTGSYNWTRGAAEDNHENVVVTDDIRLVKPFVEAYEQIWNTLD